MQNLINNLVPTKHVEVETKMNAHEALANLGTPVTKAEVQAVLFEAELCLYQTKTAHKQREYVR